MSVYTPDIPAATDLISVSQGQIQDNFTQLNTQFGIDHSPFWTGSANGTGFHDQVTMPAATAPGSQTDPQGIWHTVAGASSGNVFTDYVQPYFKNQAGDMPLVPYLLTDGSGNYSFKIGLLQVSFGRTLQTNSTTSYAFTFKTAFSNAVLYRSAAADSVNQSSNSYNIHGTNSLSSLTVFFTSGTSASANSYVYYLAIGY